MKAVTERAEKRIDIRAGAEKRFGSSHQIHFTPSIFKIAALIVRAFGKTVKPILIAFERLVSSTVISFFTSPPF